MKYRIIKDGNWYIPQHKMLFLWFAFADNTAPSGYSQCMMFKSFNEADNWLTKYCAGKQQKTVVVREYSVEKMQDSVDVLSAMDL